MNGYCPSLDASWLQTSFRKATMSLALGALAIGLFSTNAHAQQGNVYGGAGGRYFEYSCGPGQVLVGLRGSAGVLIDSIQGICAAIDARSVTINSAPQGPVIGNDRPLDKWVECPVGYAVTSAAMARNESHPHLGALALYCTELVRRDEGGTKMLELRGSGHLEGYESRYFLLDAHEGSLSGQSQCPGEYAIGIRGRDDNYLTAFGLICGPKPVAGVANPTEGRTLGKRKRPRESVIGERKPGDQGTSLSFPSAANAPRTLGKRKKRPEMGAAVANRPVGAALNSDGAAIPAPTEPPSPLINGTYLTVLTIDSSRCMKDLQSTHQREVEVNPQPSIRIPLNEINQIFGAPIFLNVQGLSLTQTTTISINVGPVVDTVPATFNGGFTPDGARFDVRFEAGTDLCRVSGTISGIRR